MMKRLALRHKGLLPLDTIEGIWRIIIATFTYVQANYAVHADVSGGDAAMRDSARFHFGFTVPFVTHEDARAVIAAVAELGRRSRHLPHGPRRQRRHLVARPDRHRHGRRSSRACPSSSGRTIPPARRSTASPSRWRMPPCARSCSTPPASSAGRRPARRPRPASRRGLGQRRRRLASFAARRGLGRGRPERDPRRAGARGPQRLRRDRQPRRPLRLQIRPLVKQNDRLPLNPPPSSRATEGRPGIHA